MLVTGLTSRRSSHAEAIENSPDGCPFHVQTSCDDGQGRNQMESHVACSSGEHGGNCHCSLSMISDTLAVQGKPVAVRVLNEKSSINLFP